MLDTFFARIRGILTRPVDTFQEAKNDPQNDILLYLFILFVFSALMDMIVVAAGLAPAGENKVEGLLFIPVYLVLVPVMGIIATFLVSLWVHLCAWLCGGRQPSAQTFAALAYSCTPSLLLGWIPVIGLVFSLWGLVLLVFGLRECQEMPQQRALLAVVIAVLPVIILLALTVIMPGTVSLMPNPSLSNGIVLVHP